MNNYLKPSSCFRTRLIDVSLSTRRTWSQQWKSMLLCLEYPTNSEEGFLEEIKEGPIQKEVDTDDKHRCKCLCSYNHAEREEQMCLVWFPREIHHREQQWWSGHRHIRTSRVQNSDIPIVTRIHWCDSCRSNRANRQPSQPCPNNYCRDYSVSKLL